MVSEEKRRENRTVTQTRRGFLTTGVVAGAAVGLAGCLGDITGGSGGPDHGYGPWESPVESSAVSWDELGDLEGTLTVYSGRTRDQIKPLFDRLEDEYSDLSISASYDDNAAQLNLLAEEGEHTAADIFYTQSSSALALFKEDGLARELPEDVIDAVDDNYSDDDGMWTGASGRVRAIQYNESYFSADELPDSIWEYAEDDRFQDIISTRPNSGTFRSFIIAMIELRGEEDTREWVRKMVDDQNATLYSSGSQQAEAVHNGEQQVALGNQYYAGRIISNNPDSPLNVAFTNNDAGCLFNVSGIAIPDGTDNESLAAEFVRHVLAAEGQDFFVDVNGEYPVVDGVEYVGDLPTLDEINPPEIDLNTMTEVETAADLLRDEGMTV